MKLLDRFGRDKLFLVGHSWGSIIGAMLAAKRPDLVRAHIGIGQVVDMKRGEEVSYRFTLDEARRLTNKRAVRQLERIGPPPYAQVSDGGVQRKWLSKFHGSTYQGGLYGPLLKNLSVRDVRPLDVCRFVAGAMFSLKTLDAEQQEVNLLRDLPEIEVPVFFCTGAGTPPSRASSLPSTRRRCERPRSRSSGSSDQGTCRTSKNPRCSRRPACRSSSSRHTRVAGCNGPLSSFRIRAVETLPQLDAGRAAGRGVRLDSAALA